VLTERGRELLALGGVLYVAAWGFGTPEMYPVAVGLMVATAAAKLWVKLLDRPMRLRRQVSDHALVEGGRITVRLEVRPDGGPLPARALLRDRMGARELAVEMERRGTTMHGRYTVPYAPRGRYTMRDAELCLADPYALADARIELDRTDTVLVYPRVFELDGLFTDQGSPGGEHGRTLLHRTAGYDLHSIRDFQQGESLRRVHWRSTAKRRKLMVKELQDMPRDEAAVLLDGDARAVAGTSPDSTFDAGVRAAASLLNALVGQGQRCSLVIHGASRTSLRLAGGGGEWAEALAALAAVEADAPRPLTDLLGEVAALGHGLDASWVFVVTAATSPALAERLVALRGPRREVALVWVDGASFGGRALPAPGPADAAALRLARAGVPVARVRRGDDLSAALSSARLRTVAHA
jgi:uncharacterized protein (DUF58 family)